MFPKLHVWLRRLEIKASRRRNWLRIAFFTYLTALLFGSLMGDHGLWTSYRLWRECRRLDREISQLQAENQQLERDVNSFRSNLRTIEQFAREELHLAAPGEIHYLFP